MTHQATHVFGKHAAFLAELPIQLQKLATRRRVIPLNARRSASVLCPIVMRESVPHILFTLRTGTLSSHANQVSFPGGHIEPNESPIEAALRETREELGATLPIRTLGLMHDVIAVTGTHVTPVLGVCDAPLDDMSVLNPCAREVAQVFTLPLAHLADPANHSFELLHPKLETKHRDGASAPHPRAGMWVPVFTGGPERIWGLTAFMLHSFLREVAAPAARATLYDLPQPRPMPPLPSAAAEDAVHAAAAAAAAAGARIHVPTLAGVGAASSGGALASAATAERTSMRNEARG
jgi:8-oxo-dGTP pyrophosphatase MutT (NUDIX family)